MIRRLLNPRLLLGIASVACILVGLWSLIEIRTPNRSWGSPDDIDELAKRDDLNVVFILIDTLRADRLGAYGYERPTSPIMDALAQTGIRFEDVLAQSTWTKCSMASIWTATYPTRNRVTRYPHGMPDEFYSPAERFRDAGFRTVGIWRNGWVAPTFGFQQGFDLYFRPKVLARPANLEQNNPSALRLEGTDHDVTMAAAEFLRSVRSERFFLYLHLLDTHQYVYDDSSDFGSSFSDIYDMAIHWVDANVGTIVAVLQQQKLLEKTILVIAADHGEAFFEHGNEGHAHDLHVETSHVPLIVTLPFRLREPIVVKSPVENVDIWPTIFDLVGMPPMEGVDGRSLVPLIEAAGRGEVPSAEDLARPRMAFLDQTWGQRSADPRPLFLVEEGKERLFLQDVPGGKVELYDRVADPGETENLVLRDPEVVKRLSSEIPTYASLPEPTWGRPLEVELDDMELGHLRALGYVVDPEERRQEERNLAMKKAHEAPEAEPAGGEVDANATP